VNTTYDVRIHAILVNKTAKRETYTIRWKVAGRPFRKTFATKALAESYRSKLIIAQREGVAFDTVSGLPEPLARKINGKSWLAHAMNFVDMKWPHSSPKHRRNTAEALVTVTLAFLSSDRGAPSDDDLRAALYGWAFNAGVRLTAEMQSADVPAEYADALKWLSANTLPVTELDDAALMRKALDALSLRLDGKSAAASTIARKRTALSSALKYAVELRLLESNPLLRVTWIAPKGTEEVDRRTVVNPEQAKALLAAVREILPDLEAFFGCMYYAALRPEEVLHLKDHEFERPKKKGGWGWLNLTGATVAIGDEWGDHTGPVENRGLKHRSRKATRRVPVAPELVVLLEKHLKEFGTGPEGRVFVTRRGPGGRYVPGVGRPPSNNTYTRVWRKARTMALSEAQQASPLARVPYHLRHAAVSLWLNSGVPATQVAEWAGHSVNVLLRTYAKCIDGEESAARCRIEAALSPSRNAE
jgi:site-specific recombinase XerD